MTPRYALGEPLGEGGTGVVVRARDVLLRRDVAIKTLAPRYAGHPGLREAFDREVRLAARLRHPNLMPILDHGVLPGGAAFFAMPLAAPFAGRPPAGWDGLRDDLVGLLDGLAWLHARGVLHRDVKPANVLRLEGRPVLADLGLAALEADLGARDRDASGTPEFKAPEQHRGETREFGPGLDLYALGRLARERAAGVPVPAGFAGWLEALAEPDPQRRVAVAADARDALAALGAPAAPLDARSPSGFDLDTWVDGAADEPPEGPGDGPPVPERAEATGRPRLRVPRRAFPESPPPPPVPEDPRVAPALAVLREPPLAGRAEDLAALWARAGAVASDGRPRAVVLAGEPGAGKTRLVAELCQLLEAAGLACAVRVEAGDGVPGAVRRLLRAWPGELPEAFADRLDRRLGAGDPLVGALVAWAAGTGGTDAPARYLRRWLAEGAARGLAVLWLEDVDRSPAGLDPALALLDDPEAPPVLVVATARAPLPAPWPAVSELRQLGGEVRSVPRLDGDATFALLDGWLRLDPVVARALADRCAGNPLLVRHLVEELAASGALVDLGGLTFALTGDPARLPLPADTEALLAERLRSAIARAPDPAATARAATRAAAAGPDRVPAEVFRALVPDGAGPLVAAGLLEVGPHGVSWASPALAAVAAAAHPADPGTLRDVAAAWVASGAPDTAARAGRALHAAGDLAGAVRPLLDALDALVLASRHRECAALAPLAVEAADAAGTRGERIRARVELGRAHLYGDRHEEALAVVAEGLALGATGTDRRSLRSIAAEVGFLRNDLDGAAAEVALALAEDGPSFRPLMQAGRVAQRRGDLDGARRLWREALAWGGRDHAGRFEAESLVRVLMADPGAPDAPALLARAGPLVEASGSALLAARLLQLHAQRARRAGDLAAAEEALRRSVRLLLDAGAVASVPVQRALLAEVLAERGDFGEARALLAPYVRLAEARGRTYDVIAGTLLLAQVCVGEGDLEGLGTALGRIRAVLHTDRSGRLAGLLGLFEGALRALLGEPGAAAAAVAVAPPGALEDYPIVARALAARGG